MMRANACEGGREGFRGRATEGVWPLMGVVVEPVFRGSRLLQKTVMEAAGIPQRKRGEKEGREFRPKGHEGHNGNTSADDKRPLSQRYIMASSPTSHDLARYSRLPTVTLEFGSPGGP